MFCILFVHFGLLNAQYPQGLDYEKLVGFTVSLASCLEIYTGESSFPLSEQEQLTVLRLLFSCAVAMFPVYAGMPITYKKPEQQLL